MAGGYGCKTIQKQFTHPLLLLYSSFPTLILFIHSNSSLWSLFLSSSLPRLLLFSLSFFLPYSYSYSLYISSFPILILILFIFLPFLFLFLFSLSFVLSYSYSFYLYLSSSPILILFIFLPFLHLSSSPILILFYISSFPALLSNLSSSTTFSAAISIKQSLGSAPKLSWMNTSFSITAVRHCPIQNWPLYQTTV